MSDQLAELARQYGGAPVGSPPPDFKASNVPVDARGVPLNAPRDARGQIITSADEEPGTVDRLNEMLGPLAHPQTLTDFARLLTLPVDTVRKAAIGAITAAAGSDLAKRGVAAAARVAGKAAAAVGDVVDPDVVGVISPRAGKVIEIAQKLRDRAAAAKPPAAPPVAVNPAAVPPTIGEAAEAAAPTAAAPAPSPVPQAPPPDVMRRLSPATEAAVGPANALPDQKLLNELAIQARRAGVKLTTQAEQAAIEAVGKGATPAEAVRAVATPAEAAPAWTPSKFHLTAEESKVAAQLIQQGKTDAEVQQAIETARAFQKRFGTPSPTPTQKRFPKGMRGRASEQD